MTNIEIREEITKKIIDGMKVSFDFKEASRVCIFASADTAEETIKQKAVMDEMTQILINNGYEITLNEMDISQYNGKRTSTQSVILRRDNDETNI